MGNREAEFTQCQPQQPGNYGMRGIHSRLAHCSPGRSAPLRANAGRCLEPVRAPVAVYRSSDCLLVEPQLLRNEQVAGLGKEPPRVRAARLRLQPGLLLRLVLQLLRLRITDEGDLRAMASGGRGRGSPMFDLAHR